MSSQKNLLLCLISLLITIISLPTSLASDIPVTSYIQGDITITLNGDWANGLNFEQISDTSTDVYTNWDSVELEDYITFTDDTTNSGFNLNIYSTDFIYQGTNPSQSDIPASNFEIIGNISNSIPIAVTKGYNDSSQNLSILSNSCASITTSNFTFNSGFYNSSTNSNYSVFLSNSPIEFLSSDGSCANIGHVRFDRARVLVPQDTAIGSYQSTITFVIIDGP